MLSLTSSLAIAGTDPQIVTKFEGSNHEITVNAERETVDVIYYDPAHFNDIDNPANDTYRNIISLLVDEDNRKFISADFTATVVVDIYWTDKSGTQQGPVRKTLEVGYKIAEGTKYDARNYFYFDNARKVKVKIISIDTHNASWDITEVLTLENRMEVKRDYKFNTSGTAVNVQAAAGELSTDNKIDELIVSWQQQSFKGITHYDVEWAWVTTEALERYKSGSPLNFDATLIFKNNSTRVTIDAANSLYKIPLIYDGSGSLFYRVRPLQYQENGDIKEGEWSAKQYSGITYYSYVNGHEPDLNWQVSTTYAEDGKRKTVISYFDGTLRSRQTVTKDNVNNNTVVAETLYDYQGRPAINILPSPTLDKVITYAKNFNRFSSGTNPKDIYDLVPVGQTICSVNTPQLDNNYGAAKYYSPNNPKVNEGFNKYIPDAEGYPYSETRYTPDATGRIASQGGVGPDYQIGAGKHSTNYYYGFADQKELNALFGTEVGDQSHYFKNMVRDANGQYSVSYVDMYGRTVATALAGAPPTDLKKLESYPTEPLPTITKNLIGKGNNVIKNGALESATTLLVSTAGPHTFHYELNPQSAEIIACNPTGQTICYDCYYDLEIRVTGTCGQTPIIISRKNFSFGNYDTLCNTTSSTLIVDTTWTLEEGEYNITKRLVLSKDAQDWYRENIFAHRNICKKLIDFYNENYQVMIAASDCAMTCASCSTTLGSYAQYRTKFLMAQGINPATTVAYEKEIESSYNEAKANCDALCNEPENKISLLRQQLLQDVTPHQGQYAKLDKDLNDNNEVEPGVVIYQPEDVNHDYGEWEINTNRKYNIFNVQPPYIGYRPERTPYYLYPIDEKDNSRFYKNDAGRRDESINTTGMGDYPAMLQPLKDKTADEFSNVFVDTSWASSLLYYHPEYFKLKKIENTPGLVNSFAWDSKLEKTDSWAAAKIAETSGYIVGSNLINKDPFFNMSGNASLKSTMSGFITSNFRNGKSMWQYAMMSVKCMGTSDPACINGIAAYPTDANTYGGSLCTSDMNNVWRIFRSLYLTIKDSLVNVYLDQQVPGINYTELKSLGYKRRFGHYGDFYNMQVANIIINSNDPEAAGEAELQATYASTCDAYIYRWEQQLLTCDVLANRSDKQQILDVITSQMKQVCIWGSNADHPYGSSTLKPGDPRTPTSFESIISSVFASYGIPASAICHPYVIDYPQPYDKQVATSDDIVIEPKDECLCGRLTELQNEKQLINYPGNLSQFIQYQHGIYIRQTLLDSLSSGCVSNCKTYDPAITIPSILNCNTPLKNCITCDEYSTLRTTYRNQYPGFTVIYRTPQSDEELNRNIAFAQFMNLKTGFRKSWLEYVQFEIACENFNQTWTCNRLDSIVTVYNQANAGTNNYGENCQQSFTTFFNQSFGTYYTFNAIAALYSQYCGHSILICQPTLNCTGFNQAINDFYQLYGASIVNSSSCQQLFVSFFNNRYSSNYTWSSLQSLYYTLCEKVLEVCNPFNCQRLQLAMNDWRSQHSLAWADTDCMVQWVNFFNAWFQSNMQEWQIAQLYAGCNISYSPCLPPLQCATLQQMITMYNNSGTAACDSSGLSSSSSTYCTDCFAWFVNHKLNTAYTFEQISLMYLKSCGTNIPLCQGVYTCQGLTTLAANFSSTLQTDIGNCSTTFTTYFNNYYSTNLSYSQIMAIYKLYCGQWPSICGKVPITSCQQLTNVKNDFLTSYPNPGGYFGLNCQQAFAQYFNQVFGDTLSYPAIEKYYISLCGVAPNVCDTSACQTLRNFLTTYHQQYDTLSLPVSLCRDLFTKLLNNQLQTLSGGGGGSFGGKGEEPPPPSKVYTWAEVAAMYQNCGINLNICYTENGPLTTCSKIKGAKTAFYILYPTATSSLNCGQLFTEFFNLYFNTSFTSYSSLEQWVTLQCGGPALNICGNSSGGGGESEVGVGPQTNASVPLPTAPRLCETTNLFPTIIEDTTSSCEYIKTMALNAATEQYNIYLTKQKDDFNKRYTEKCFTAAIPEVFTVTSKVSEYHYTLYYYDRAGSLVKTIPPSGVHPIYTQTFYDQVEAAKISGVSLVPSHTLPTQYRYNTLGQVVQQKSPDGGLSKFWYDALGRLVVSQNAKQLNGNKYSYTQYDLLGRITEVGQLTNNSTISQTITQNDGQLASWISGVNNSKEQMTKTVYDVARTELCVPAPSILCQQNLRNRVSYTYVQPTANFNNNNLPYSSATYYTYDIHGNVDVLLQHYNDGIMQTVAGNAFKRIEYKYDLISGKVNEVAYQPGVKDQFYHRYYYDAENKLVKAETSSDYVYWQQQATYSYYRHGPLARTEIGQLGVQGIDNAYTLQGWLKGVNSSTVSSGFDVGGDGANNGRTARDAYGFSLNYNTTDYKSINNTVTPFAAINSGLPQLNADGINTGKNLYNGNIRGMLVNIPKLGDAKLYGYQYDQLNRITAMNTYNGLNTSTNIFSPAATDDYKERVSYDGNGNILTYLRNGSTQGGSPLAMDNLSYNYVSNSNKLSQVTDAVGATNYNTDIDNQTANNYDYDNIGNLVKDNAEGITNIEWNVYGKITRIEKYKDYTTTTIEYTYDASGNRISKSVATANANYNQNQTWYVRDASGNVMAVYQRNISTTGTVTLPLTQTEVHLYGSSRLGLWQAERNVEQSNWWLFDKVAMAGTNGGVLELMTRGRTAYELSNHLQNVFVTLSDKKIGVDGNNDGQIEYYTTDIITANDYYLFGMDMPARKFGGVSRYGFNGKENDRDLSEGGQDYGLRIYDRRIGRFLSVDPLTEDYPFYTPYQFAGNDVIRNIDLDGGEPKPVTTGKEYEGQSETTKEEPRAGYHGLYSTTDQKSQTWTFHEGGVNGSKAGWMTQESYYNEILKPIAKQYNNDNWRPEWDFATTRKGDHSYYFGMVESVAKYIKENPTNDSWDKWIPIWGPLKQAKLDFSVGKWGWGTFNTVLGVSDIFLVKSVLQAPLKSMIKFGPSKGLTKYFGIGMSHEYGASVSRWKNLGLEMSGYKHHWLLSQEMMEAHSWLKPFGNQTWNLTRFESQASHMRFAHGQIYGGVKYPFSNFLYPFTSTPGWLKFGLAPSVGGRVYESKKRN